MITRSRFSQRCSRQAAHVSHNLESLRSDPADLAGHDTWLVCGKGLRNNAPRFESDLGSKDTSAVEPPEADAQ